MLMTALRLSTVHTSVRGFCSACIGFEVDAMGWYRTRNRTRPSTSTCDHATSLEVTMRRTDSCLTARLYASNVADTY